MRGKQVSLVLLLLLLGLGLRSLAHEVRPGYLQITETPDHSYEILWKQPTMGERAVRLIPHLSGGWLEAEPTQVHVTSSFMIKLWKRPAGTEELEGQTLSIEGLENTITDVLVAATRADGKRIQHILRPQQPTLVLRFDKNARALVPAYLKLGVEHILTGFDHLMFVLGLILLVKRQRQLIATITAFTVAHSITLAGTTLELFRVKPALVESLVALTIIFVAVEIVHAYRGRSGVTMQYPWVMAFAFGLLHGLAFAGALADIGLPSNDIPLSLLLFNIGVEIGQLLFVTVVLVFVVLIRRLPRQPPQLCRWLAPYAIGSSASLWLIERFLPLLPLGLIQ